jgi:hypothetical protein
MSGDRYGVHERLTLNGDDESIKATEMAKMG